MSKTNEINKCSFYKNEAGKYQHDDIGRSDIYYVFESSNSYKSLKENINNNNNPSFSVIDSIFANIQATIAAGSILLSILSYVPNKPI